MAISVLHVLGSAKVDSSAYARTVAVLASKLDPEQFRLHACFLGPSGPLLAELRNVGAIVRNIQWIAGAQDVIGASRFLRYLRQHDFAIVHQHRIFGERSRSICWLVKSATRARSIVHIHGQADNISVGDIYETVSGADRIIAVSRSLARQIAPLNPVVIYNGVPLRGNITGSDRSSAGIIIGTVCRLVASKGLTDLLEAMALLCVQFPSMQLEIAGSGPQQYDLEREVDRLKLSKNVRFLGWQRDVRSVMQSWNIFAFPSRNEGIPIAVLEAMSEGLPVVATNVGGLPELIEEGRSGFLVPPSDVLALAGRLRELVLDPELRQSLAAAGRTRISDYFSDNQMAQQIQIVYNEVRTS